MEGLELCIHETQVLLDEGILQNCNIGQLCI